MMEGDEARILEVASDVEGVARVDNGLRVAGLG